MTDRRRELLDVLAVEPGDATIHDVEMAPALQDPVAYGPMISQDGVTPPELICTLHRRFNLRTPVAVFDEMFGAKWQEILNDAGSAEISVLNTDPDLLLLRDGDILRFEHRGYATFVMLIAERTVAAVAGGEERDQITTLKGPGHIAALGEALVYPARGVGKLPIQEDRVFNWTASDFDDAAWPLANPLHTAGTLTDWHGPLEGWPDPTAVYVWGWTGDLRYAPSGSCYFRDSFAVPEGLYPDQPQQIVLYLGADDTGTMYFDGAQAVDTEDNRPDYHSTYSVVLDVTAGQHWVSAVATNAGVPLPDPLLDPMIHDVDADPNPAGLLGAAYLYVNGTPTTLLWHTSAATRVIEYPPQPPGMTPGEVIRHAIQEAQARGALPHVLLNFTDETDSDGRAWPIVGDIATKVGTDVWTFIKELTDTYVDVWMEPASFTLWAWRKDGRGEARDIAFLPAQDPTDPWSGNLAGLTYKRVV